MSPPTERRSPPSSRLVRVLGLVGVLSACPVACGSTCGWVANRADATADAPRKGVEELVQDPPPRDALAELQASVDTSRRLAVAFDQGGSAFLVGIHEDPRLLLLVRELPEPGSRSLLVYRDDARFVGDPLQAGRSDDFEAAFGRAFDDTVVYTVGDLRPGASREAQLAGWVAVIAWLVSLLSLTGARILARREQPQTTP